MDFGRKKIGGKKVYPFTIPSGIITTEAATIQKFIEEIPELGIITTKSIGIEPRMGNREPILAQCAGDNGVRSCVNGPFMNK
jgi:dihydroorotate dehydrogenase